MKNLIQNIIFILLAVSIFFIVLKRIEETNRKCTVGIERTESILRSGEVIEYESN